MPTPNGASAFLICAPLRAPDIPSVRREGGRFTNWATSLRVPDIPVRVGQVDLILAAAKPNEVLVDPLATPTCSPNLGLSPTAITHSEPLLAPPVIELTHLIQPGTLTAPEIAAPFTPLGKTRADGKSYRDSQDTQPERLLSRPQLTPFNKPQVAYDPSDRCIHGLPRAGCAQCQQKRAPTPSSQKEKLPPPLDPFEIILPTLQPPFTGIDTPYFLPPDKELYGYQSEGIQFLMERSGALLADEMGLGKTVQAIVAAAVLFRQGKMSQALVLCPRSVLGHWRKLFQEWAPKLRTLIVRGPKVDRWQQWGSRHHVLISTYDTLREDILEPDVVGTVPRRLDLVVLDEAQYVKNPSAKRSQAVREIAAARCWGLTGTPLENRVEELQAIFAHLQRAALEDASANTTCGTLVTDRQVDTKRRRCKRDATYVCRWCDVRYCTQHAKSRPCEHSLTELGMPTALEGSLLELSPHALREAIRPYLLRRRAADVLDDLPEKHRNERWLELTPKQRESYRDAEENGIIYLRKLKEEVTVQHILALITKLKQICNFDPRTGSSCKTDYLLEELEKVRDKGEKALVFSQYVEESGLAALERHLRKFHPARFHGQLSDLQREEVVQQFQEGNRNQVLLMSVKAGGLGLTLTRANHVFHFDQWWTPAAALQAEHRAYRIGQEKPVHVTEFFVHDTIEERIHAKLAEKQHLFDTVIDELTTEGISQALTREELFALFDLPDPGQHSGQRRQPPPVEAPLADSPSPYGGEGAGG